MNKLRAISKAQSEAEYWLVMMRSPNFDAKQEAAFFAWLERSPMHQAAYIKAEEVWQRGEVLARAQEPEAASWFAFLRINTFPQAALACVMMLALSLGFYWQIQPQAPQVEWHQTGLGEQKEVTLADGSVVVLNTNSKIKTVISGSMRSVYLEQGEAFFDVAHDTKRPFDVHTQAGMVRVLGTKFNVYDSGEQTVVTVLEGSVGVDKQARNSTPSEGGEGNFSADVTLVRNQEIVVEEADAAAKPKEVDASAKLGWRTKRLIFRSDSLQTVVTELNRYFDTQLILATPELAEKEVAAVIQITDFDTMLNTLKQALDLRADKDQANNTVLLTPVAVSP